MMIGRALVLVLLVSSLGFAQSPPQPPLTARATQHPSQAVASPPLVIPFEFLVNRPLVRATINGEGPFAFLLAADTEPSRLDPELAEALKLKAAEGETTVTVELSFDSAPYHTGKTVTLIALAFSALWWLAGAFAERRSSV